MGGIWAGCIFGCLGEWVYMCLGVWVSLGGSVLQPALSCHDAFHVPNVQSLRDVVDFIQAAMPSVSSLMKYSVLE